MVLLLVRFSRPLPFMVGFFVRLAGGMMLVLC